MLRRAFFLNAVENLSLAVLGRWLYIGYLTMKTSSTLPCIKLKIVPLFTLVFILSCQSRSDSNKTDEQQVADSSSTVSPASTMTFYDSVLQKKDLSFEQIKARALFDSVHYTGYYSTATFAGDTLLHLRNNLTGVVIAYGSPVCYQKFLILFNKEEKEMSRAEVYTGCDGPENEDYSSTDYRVLNDSTYETIETFRPANADEKNLPEKITKVKWRISQNGAIVQVR